MNFEPVDKVYKRVKNKYLACVVIAKRAKRYNQENYLNIISKGEEASVKAIRREPVKDAFKDFHEGELNEIIKEHE